MYISKFPRTDYYSVQLLVCSLFACFPNFAMDGPSLGNDPVVWQSKEWKEEADQPEDQLKNSKVG